MPAPTFQEAVGFWWKLGWVSFGGPTGQIAMLHTEVVERKKWISESEFLHGLNFCMMLPGPEAQQLVTYVGWKLHGTRGALAAGILFILPAVIILWLLAWLYVVAGGSRWVSGIFDGLVPAVLAIIAAATIRLARRTLRHPVLWVCAALAFCALFFFNVYFPIVIGGAALAGWMLGRLAPVTSAKLRNEESAPCRDLAESGTARPGSVVGRSGRILGIGLALWWSPILLCGWIFGWGSIFVKMGWFFSKAALVTFGGAYAVLPFVAQEAVSRQGWLTADQMVAGLAMAETTPGPLIMVLQFVGFIGAWHDPGSLPPLLAASLAALLTTWVTFVPCFLFIFLAAPCLDSLRTRPALGTALTLITAAVVGVILNLAVWFAIHAMVAPDGTLQLLPLVLAGAYLFALVRFGWGIGTIVAIGAITGLAMAF